MRLIICTIILLLSQILGGCIKPEVVKTGSNPLLYLPPTPIDAIEIYRSMVPDWNYREIGIVTVKNIPHLDIIYEKFRHEASLCGADAVIGFQLDSDEKMVTYTYTTMVDDRPQIHTESYLETTHTATGTLIYKAED